ncbi:hypothetical protein PCAR4_150039 [Paraburkholderia caribensis]|nr:hypothetical protein PCAR4_150039 [Paraburkholderia caribensis]
MRFESIRRRGVGALPGSALRRPVAPRIASSSACEGGEKPGAFMSGRAAQAVR